MTSSIRADDQAIVWRPVLAKVKRLCKFESPTAWVADRARWLILTESFPVMMAQWRHQPQSELVALAAALCGGVILPMGTRSADTAKVWEKTLTSLIDETLEFLVPTRVNSARRRDQFL